MAGEFTALFAEVDERDRILVLAVRSILFLDLPFDRKTVAIPAGDVAGILALHLGEAVDDIFQDLVQRMADMQMAVRVRGAVVKQEDLAAFCLLAKPMVKAHRLPMLQQFRLVLGQARLHRKGGLGKKNGFLVATSHG